MNLLALLCAAAINGPGQIAQRVTVEYRATRVPVLLQELGAKVAMKLESEPRFTNEVLILRAKDVKLDELMKRIADVCDAGWERTKQGYLLKRANQVQRELQQRDTKLRVDAIQKVFDAEAKTLAKWDTPDKRAGAILEGYEMARKAAEQGDGERIASAAFYQPAHQFYLKLLFSIGPERLATQPTAARVAYASPHNMAQQPLPASYKKLLAEVYETGEAVQRMFDENGPPGVPQYAGKQWLEPYFKPFRVAKSIFVITNEDWGTFGYLGLYDSNGKILTSGANLRVQYSFPAQPWTTDLKLEPVPLSLESRALQAAVTDNDGMDDMLPTDKSLPEAALQLFINPETRDPLSYHISDAFLGLADQTGRMLVGRIPDHLWRFMRLREKPDTINLSAALSSAAAAGVRVRDEDGWISLKLENPIQVESTRTRRDSLGALLRASLAAKKIDFADYCRYQFQTNTCSEFTGLSRTYRNILTGIGVRPAVASGWIPPRLMAFLGTLSPTQWQTLKSGAPLYLNALTSIQKQAFEKVVPIASSREGHENDEQPAAILRNPSECIPFGPTAQTYIKFIPDTHVVVKGLGEGVLTRIPVAAEHFGTWLASMAHEAKSDNFAEFLPRELSVGMRTGYKWEIELIPGIVYGPADFYEGSTLEPTKKAFKDLPEDFQAQVRKHFEAELASLKKGGG
jgi:hypothetical protein